MPAVQATSGSDGRRAGEGADCEATMAGMLADQPCAAGCTRGLEPLRVRRTDHDLSDADGGRPLHTLIALASRRLRREVALKDAPDPPFDRVTRRRWDVAEPAPGSVG